MKLGVFLQVFEIYSNMKFHENPASGTRIVHVDRRTDGEMDMTNLIVAFYNFANASEERMTPVN